MTKNVDRKSILVVDDEENLRHMLSVMLDRQGYKVDVAANGREALNALRDNSYAFILSDIKMPIMDGMEFLRQAIAREITGTIIMMSAYGTIEDAIECMKIGAYDYVSKPFKRDEIVLVLKKAEERERLKEENRRLREEIHGQYSFANMIGKSRKMQEIFSLVKKVSEVKTTVLILGESGTGKELVARAIHHNGPRKEAPFVAVNCGAIPDNLLESELFGHMKGAFTDAGKDKPGLFEEADGGTLFLDEIGEMPPSLQVKLLRVLQEGEVRRLGSGAAKKIDVRIVSATSKDLAKEVAAGSFREDLFYRLNVFTLSLPPLRERKEDIPLLVEHFVHKHGVGLNADLGLGKDFLRPLLNHEWPGNVRELENVVERVLVQCDGLLHQNCLPKELHFSPQNILSVIENTKGSYSIKQATEKFEKELIGKALEKTGGNRTHAAKLLEISHRALLYKIKEYGL